MPMFSVIIPTFNRERYIAATIRSALDQTLQDHEIIVVDDESTDRTIEVARSFGSKVIVLEQRNQGPGEARNLGARHARGEYLAFLDSDDLWFPWTLETYRRLIASRGRPPLITGSAYYFDDESTLGAVGKEDDRFEVFPDYLAAGPERVLPGGAFMIVRTDVFKKSGGFTRQRVYSEDADLYLRLGTEPGYVAVRSPYTVAYRRHGGSAMHDTPRLAAGLDLILENERAGVFPGGAARRPERWRFHAHNCRNISFNAARIGQFRLAMRLYIAGFVANLAQRRWRFLLGLPLVATAGALGIRKSRDQLHGALAAEQSKSD